MQTTRPSRSTTNTKGTPAARIKEAWEGLYQDVIRFSTIPCQAPTTIPPTTIYPNSGVYPSSTSSPTPSLNLPPVSKHVANADGLSRSPTSYSRTPHSIFSSTTTEPHPSSLASIPHRPSSSSNASHATAYDKMNSKGTYTAHTSAEYKQFLNSRRPTPTLPTITPAAPLAMSTPLSSYASVPSQRPNDAMAQNMAYVMRMPTPKDEHAPYLGASNVLLQARIKSEQKPYTFFDGPVSMAALLEQKHRLYSAPANPTKTYATRQGHVLGPVEARAHGGTGTLGGMGPQSGSTGSVTDPVAGLALARTNSAHTLTARSSAPHTASSLFSPSSSTATLTGNSSSSSGLPNSRRPPASTPLLAYIQAQMDARASQIPSHLSFAFPMSVEHLYGLLNALAAQPMFAAVTSLSFRGARFGDAGVAVLASRLSLLPQLQWLDLSDCGITAVGCAQLAKHLYRSEDGKDRGRKGHPVVFGSNDDLDITLVNSTNPVTKPVRIRRAQTEGWSGTGNGGSTARGKGKNGLSARASTASTVSLAARLNLSSGRYICPLLGLYMSHNPIQDEGARALCTALTKNHFLREFDLSYCGLTSKSCGYIASMVSSSVSVLESLSVRGNDFGVFGCVTLLQGLWSRETLKRLDVGATRMLNPIYSADGSVRTMGTSVGGSGIERGVKEVGDGDNNKSSGLPSRSAEITAPSNDPANTDDPNNAISEKDLEIVPMAVQDYYSVVATLPIELHGLVTLVYTIRSCPALASISLDGNGVDTRGARLLLDNLADLAHVREMNIDQRIDAEIYKEILQWLLHNKPVKKKKLKKKEKPRW